MPDHMEYEPAKSFDMRLTPLGLFMLVLRGALAQNQPDVADILKKGSSPKSVIVAKGL